MSESNDVENVKKVLGPEVANLLNIFEKDGSVCLKPKTFLGKDVFKDIAQSIKDLGGNYENGLFKIPLKSEKPKEIATSYDEVHQMVMDLRNYVEKSTEGILKKLGDLKRQ